MNDNGISSAVYLYYYTAESYRAQPKNQRNLLRSKVEQTLFTIAIEKNYGGIGLELGHRKTAR